MRLRTNSTSCFPQLLREFPSRAEDRIEPRTYGVIAAGYTDVVRYFEALCLAGPYKHHARSVSIAGKDGCDRIVSRQHRLGAQIPAFGVFFAIDAALERRQTSLLHGAAIALEATGGNHRQARVLPTKQTRR